MLAAGVRVGMRFPNTMDEVKDIEKGWRNRHGAIHAPPALLEAFENDDVGGEATARLLAYRLDAVEKEQIPAGIARCMMSEMYSSLCYSHVMSTQFSAFPLWHTIPNMVI